MPVEPTEELFDILMKQMSNETLESYDSSDSESETFTRQNFKESISKNLQEIIGGVYKPENSESNMSEVKGKIDSGEKLTRSLIYDNLNKKLTNNLLRTSPHACEKSSDFSTTMDKGQELPNPSRTLSHSVGSNNVVSMEMVTVDVNDVEECAVSQNNIDLGSGEFSQDSAESLGTCLVPPACDADLTVETITVDVNENVQDDCVTVQVDEFDDANTLKDQCSDSSFLSHSGKSESSQFPEEHPNTSSELKIETSFTTVNDDELNVHQTEKQENNQVVMITDSNVTLLDKQITCDRFGDMLPLVSTFLNVKKRSSDKMDEEGEESNCKCYVCKGCDSKFWILRFYYQHVSRVTAKILYDCKICKKKMVFTNPCLLKVHFKLHGESVNDIKINDSFLSVGLPSINEFEKKYLLEFQPSSLKKTFEQIGDDDSINICEEKCSECNTFVPSLVDHLLFKQQSDGYRKCPSCPFIFTSNCSLKMHERIHNYQRPYHCPECGVCFVTRTLFMHHLYHECYHFLRGIFAKCYFCSAIVKDVKVLKNHMLIKHRSTFYKCHLCLNRSFRFISALNHHMKENHGSDITGFNLIRVCELCPNSKWRTFPEYEYDDHLMSHINKNPYIFNGFSCPSCKIVTQNKVQFQEHMEQSATCRIDENAVYKKFQQCFEIKSKNIVTSSCRKPVQKKISNSPIKCLAEDLKRSTNVERDLDGTSEMSDSYPSNSNSQIQKTLTCLLCNSYFYSLDRIKSHILNYHKCKNIQNYIKITSPVSSKKKRIHIIKPKLNTTRNSNDKSTNNVIVVNNNETVIKNELQCSSCNYIASSKDDFRKHVVIHRESGAYQCLECGECFVSRNPLEIHLVSAHSIKDVSDYISSHFVHNSFSKPKETSDEAQPNQCSVCFDSFPDEKTLHLHFRSHGMAFLRQNFAKRVPP